LAASLADMGLDLGFGGLNGLAKVGPTILGGGNGGLKLGGNSIFMITSPIKEF